MIIGIIVANGKNMPLENGYRMWLRYDKITDGALLKKYRSNFLEVDIPTTSPTMLAAKEELNRGLSGLLDSPVSFSNGNSKGVKFIVGTPSNSSYIASFQLEDQLEKLGQEGFLIKNISIKNDKAVVIAANTDVGILYGTFAFLRNLQQQKMVEDLEILSKPKLKLRMVDHWDNADRSVERGYAGLSLWDWSTLPEYNNPRYKDFARITASIGINAIAINNVNADAKFITPQFLEKIAVLADTFRPYGIKIFLAINYSSPMILGNLNSADPLNDKVAKWWQDKSEEIYHLIPDFGGFLVKADSEGQPGPKTYHRDHAQGANMLAKAISPHNGLIIWRAFVYGHSQEDRIREAYDEFLPLDGKFADNVVLQIKNGPLDFMPREPFSPLFGALKKTNLMIEFQLTQEYLGHSKHLLFKAPMFKETLDSETYANGENATVAEILEGKIFDSEHSGMTAVVNPGNTINWTGHPFVQSSWYSIGRLAWDYTLTSDDLAEEWIRMTFSNNEKVISTLKKIMQQSSEAAIDYREPLGLTHIGTGIHYGPAPWSSRSKSFHHADTLGLGFDRTTTGSNAVAQYNTPLDNKFENIATTPEKYLLWFHHVDWDYTMKSGRNLWEELVYKYYSGVELVGNMQKEFQSLKGLIDKERFEHIKSLLKIQKKDAVIWRNACVLYFQTFSNKPIPNQYEEPDHDLLYYKEFVKENYFSQL